MMLYTKQFVDIPFAAIVITLYVYNMGHKYINVSCVTQWERKWLEKTKSLTLVAYVSVLKDEPVSCVTIDRVAIVLLPCYIHKQFMDIPFAAIVITLLCIQHGSLI